MKKEELKNEVDRKHADRAEKRNRARTYKHKNTATLHWWEWADKYDDDEDTRYKHTYSFDRLRGRKEFQ